MGLGGPAAFRSTGNEFLGYLVDLCGLQPGDAVLDVGCGSGRMALPLAGYLNGKGRYAGFDVSTEAIAWCTENIGASHPNFNFSVVDVQSQRYNPSGKQKSSEFHFPYPDGSFDVVLLASIFTHMLPADLKQYMSEIVRVLKPGGRSLITFFLLNEESSALNAEGKGVLKFEHEVQGARTANAVNPEAAIAYPESFVRNLYAECGLELKEPLHYGNWCGRTDAMSGQDVVIAVKAASKDRPDDRELADSGIQVTAPGQEIVDAEVTVRGLYRHLLGRTPREKELRGWSAYASQGATVLDLVESFVATEEYKRQLQAAPEEFSLPKFGRCFSFDKSGDSDDVIGPGWSVQEDAHRWMTGQFSVLALPMPTESKAADFILMLRVAPFTANGQIDCQRCTVVCGAETVAEVRLVLPVPTWIGFRVSAKSVVSGKLAILFVHPDAGSPQQFGVAPDSRELAIAVHEAVLLPVTEADELRDWRGKTGRFVSSDWRAQALVPDWKSIASKFQSVGQDCEFGIVQRQCEAEPLGLFRFCNTWLHGLIQCFRSEFSQLTDEAKLNIYPSSWGEYVGEYKTLNLTYHTLIPTDQNLDVDAFRRKELIRLKMMVRLFREDLEDGEKVFVLLRKFAPLDEFEVLPLISLMHRYNPKAALLWVTVAGPDEEHLVGQCQIVGNNLLKGYIDGFPGLNEEQKVDWSTLSLGCWKDIMVSALQALGRPIPTLAEA